MASADCRNQQKYSYLRFVLAGLVGIIPGVALAQSSPVAFPELVSRATAARVENDLPHAIQLYGQALQLNPEWKEGWWYLGSLQYQTDAYSAARDALTRYIALNPDAGPAIALRGLCEFETSEYGSSLQDIERGLSVGAASELHNEQILRYHEALLLARLGKFQDALRAYAWFARKGITSAELMEEIGLAGLRTAVLPEPNGDKRKSLFIAAGNAAYRYMAGQESEARACRSSRQQETRKYWTGLPSSPQICSLPLSVKFAPAKWPPRSISARTPRASLHFAFCKSSWSMAGTLAFASRLRRT